ncbi:hypothetical protein PQR46_18710 [Paraburkholderia sediminicola]|uniref:hypothetical protein n=1 Tax=Paraburkholderia sediminicola TaxID=458836 RepID=UPI0038B7D62A
MVAKRITDEEWAEARRIYETTPGMGLGKIASQVLDCSKNLVVRKSQEQGWQKTQDAARATGKTGQVLHSNLTESATRTTTQAVHVSDPAPPVSPVALGRVVSDVYVAPSAPGVRADGIAVRPEFTNGVDELAWIEEQVSIREKAILERHAVELRALTNSIYDAARKTGKAEMGAASRAANQLSQALERKQKMEREHCAMQTRIELGAHYGAGPRPAVIVVHQHPDGKLT